METNKESDFVHSKVNPTENSTNEVIKTDLNLSVAQDSEALKEASVKQENEVLYEIDKRGENAFTTANESMKTGKNVEKENISEGVVKIPKPLCADYRSDSESDSLDSESDSTTSTDSSTETSSDSDGDEDDTDSSGKVKHVDKLGNKKNKTDLSVSDLPPIEDLKISVPEDECVEIGSITSIVDTLVVVESYKGTAALDIDTVLFLDCGKRSLGKVFDILGPVSEPVYAVRFNSQDQIKNCNIEKGMKVYCAPKTPHTSFVFLSEVLKNKGSDASWKDNIEAPSEFQDFSDDEEERLHKNKENGNVENLENCGQDRKSSRKRSFNRTGQIIQPSRFRNPEQYHQRRTAPPRFTPPAPQFRPPHVTPQPYQMPPFAYGAPPYQGLPPPPRTFYPPRFSGPPFPTFGAVPYVTPNYQFQQPLCQQRARAFPDAYGPWSRPMFRHVLPPPPPPPRGQEESENSVTQGHCAPGGHKHPTC